MRIYFCGSIRGGRDDASLYLKIVEHLKTFGQVLTEHVASPQLSADVNAGVDNGLTSAQIHDRDIDWLKSCDAIVAEVTTPSLGVGYEIGRALDINKPILCLFRTDAGRRLSAMIEGAPKPDNKIRVEYYTELKDALSHVSTFFKAGN